MDSVEERMWRAMLKKIVFAAALFLCLLLLALNALGSEFVMPRVLVGDFGQSAVTLYASDYELRAGEIEKLWYDGANNRIGFIINSDLRCFYEWSIDDQKIELKFCDNRFTPLINFVNAYTSAEKTTYRQITLFKGNSTEVYRFGNEVYLFNKNTLSVKKREEKVRKIPCPPFKRVDSIFPISATHIAIVSSEEGICIVNKALEPNKPLVLNEIYMDGLIQDFKVVYPDIRIEKLPLTALEKMKARLGVESIGFDELQIESLEKCSGIMDIWWMSTKERDDMSIKKNLLMDISASSVVSSHFVSLYSIYQKAICSGSKLIGVPMEASVKFWSYNKDLWNAFGLDELETMENLIRDMQYFNELQYSEKITVPWGQYSPDLYTGCKQFFDTWLMDEYISQKYEEGKPVPFDNASFRELMVKLKGYKKEMSEAEEKTDTVYECASSYPVMLEHDYKSIDREGLTVILAPYIDDPSDVKTRIDSVQTLVIDKETKNPEAALRFLEFAAMNNQENAPLLVEGNHEVIRHEQNQGSINMLYALQDQLKDYLGTETGSNNTAAKKELARVDEQIQKAESERPLYDADFLALYRDVIVPTLQYRESILYHYIYIQITGPIDTPVYDENIIDDYINGKVDLDEAVHYLEEKSKRLYEEWESTIKKTR